MTHLEHIASRIIGQPLLILPAKLGLIAQVLAGRVGLDLEKPELGLEVSDRPEPLASRFVGKSNDPDPRVRPKYMVTDAGAALITITGSLVNRGAWIGANSGLTSYEGIAAQIRAAIEDPRVASIMLDIESPGGQATGAFELADIIRAANEVKPMTAFVNGMAASAGYMIASGAPRIISVPSGLSGSIGVVMMHADYSRALDRAGITPTLIHAGSHKVDANPYQPLDADVKAKLQAEVETMRGAFAETVAKGRGKRMSAKAALDTEAAMFSGPDAKTIGLVDDLATFDALFDDMNRSAARSRSSARRASMEFTQADLDKSHAAGHAAGFTAGKAEGLAEGKVAGHTDGLKAGAEAERTRIKAIVEHPEAKGREQLAAHYAYATTEAPAQAEAALKAAPKSGASLGDRMKDASSFHTADTHNRAKPVIDANAIYASLNKAG